MSEEQRPALDAPPPAPAGTPDGTLPASDQRRVVITVLLVCLAIAVLFTVLVVLGIADFGM